jgi:hypothetical protein
MAESTGITLLQASGGFFLCCVHHSIKAQSGWMKKPCLGDGASVNALEMSAPKISRFSAAAMT